MERERRRDKVEFAYRCLDQIRIFHHLGEQETFLIIKEASPHSGVVVDIGNGGEAVFGATRGVDRDEGVPGPILIFLVPYHVIKGIVR